jgi:predicted ester cyclase
MTIDFNIRLVRDWVDQIWNARKYENLSRFHPPSFHNEGRISSIKETENWHKRMSETFPDLHYSIRYIMASNDRVAFRWTASATHEGIYWGFIQPTGKKIEWPGSHFVRIDNLKIVEIWAVADLLSQVRQMGMKLVPSPEAEQTE